MGLDTDLDLMKIVGGPDFVWGPPVAPTGDPDSLDPSEVCRILGLTALNSLLQYVNWLVWEVCSVN